jgi:hypothetical protein
VRVYVGFRASIQISRILNPIADRRSLDINQTSISFLEDYIGLKVNNTRARVVFMQHVPVQRINFLIRTDRACKIRKIPVILHRLRTSKLAVHTIRSSSDASAIATE